MYLKLVVIPRYNTARTQVFVYIERSDLVFQALPELFASLQKNQPYFWKSHHKIIRALCGSK